MRFTYKCSISITFEKLESKVKDMFLFQNSKQFSRTGIEKHFKSCNWILLSWSYFSKMLQHKVKQTEATSFISLHLCNLNTLGWHFLDGKNSFNSLKELICNFSQQVSTLEKLKLTRTYQQPKPDQKHYSGQGACTQTCNIIMGRFWNKKWSHPKSNGSYLTSPHDGTVSMLQPQFSSIHSCFDSHAFVH